MFWPQWGQPNLISAIYPPSPATRLISHRLPTWQSLLAAGLAATLKFFQIFSQKLSNLLEPGDIPRINLHQRLMGFQAGARDLFARRGGGRKLAGFPAIRYRPLRNVE